ncbi:MAG TPA: hypothetical protein VGQ99_21950, partial [Tepidisphaeraceae bacterium]|nr:hypothetical protein [Tepidisphaeraceae bacterium]
MAEDAEESAFFCFMAEQSSLRRDIVSAYLASGAKIGSWVVVSAMVYRLGWHAQFGLLALIRGTLGILNYVSVGIVSALVRMIAETHSQPQEVTAATTGRVLSYYAPAKQSRVAVLYSNAITWTALFATIATFFLIGYAFFFEEFHRVPVSLSGWSVAYTVLFLGLGLLIRLISDAPGAVLQTTGRIAYDNRLLIEAELLWVVATWGLFESKVWNQQIMVHAAMGFLIASLFLIIRRLIGASLAAGIPRIRLDETITRPLLRMGA